jgi:hypothetical protein
MKTKPEIVANWLSRYTGMSLREFGKHILPVNFNHFVRRLAKWHGRGLEPQWFDLPALRGDAYVSKRLCG